MTGLQVWGDGDGGWQELPGVRDVRIELAYDPPDPVVDRYGLGEMRRLSQTIETNVDEALQSWFRGLFAAELLREEQLGCALEILRPHLAWCPLYVGP
ncbi:hypothetical protein [Streptomyces sp. NPDC005732]|uniref:hypothetical protein n=1 Tax=Streptomyces sp. NPDC005732 TaxID=3157057 RepID=UPI0033DDFB36